MDDKAKLLEQWVDRLKRGEDIATVREWFLKEMAKDEGSYYAQLTPLNKVFLDSIFFNFQESARLGHPLKKRPKH